MKNYQLLQETNDSLKGRQQASVPGFEGRGAKLTVDHLDQILKNCQPFLKQIDHSPTEHVLYRGTQRSLDQPEQKVRKDRQPTDTPPPMHKLIDSTFKQMFHFPYRSSGLFVTGNRNIADDYGEVAIIFPIGDFSFLWSPAIPDLFAKVDDGDMEQDIIHELMKLLKKEKRLNDIEMKAISSHFHFTNDRGDNINDIITHYPKLGKLAAANIFKQYKYTDKNLKAAIDSNHEIMIGKMNHYYMFTSEVPSVDESIIDMVGGKEQYEKITEPGYNVFAGKQFTYSNVPPICKLLNLRIHYLDQKIKKEKHGDDYEDPYYHDYEIKKK